MTGQPQKPICAKGGVAERHRWGKLEHEVLTALSAAPGPLTPTMVQAVLPRGRALTTVSTVLRRLHSKGLAKRARQGRTYAYQPAPKTREPAARPTHAVPDPAGAPQQPPGWFRLDLAAVAPSGASVLRTGRPPRRLSVLPGAPAPSPPESGLGRCSTRGLVTESERPAG